jgi:predicted amidohydrolase YtcJ
MSADLILYNGCIHTIVRDNPNATAVEIKDVVILTLFFFTRK